MCVPSTIRNTLYCDQSTVHSLHVIILVYSSKAALSFLSHTPRPILNLVQAEVAPFGPPPLKTSPQNRT